MGLYTVILEIGLGPKGYHSFVEGGGPTFGPLPHPPKPGWIGLGTGAGLSKDCLSFVLRR